MSAFPQGTRVVVRTDLGEETAIVFSSGVEPGSGVRHYTLQFGEGRDRTFSVWPETVVSEDRPPLRYVTNEEGDVEVLLRAPVGYVSVGTVGLVSQLEGGRDLPEPRWVGWGTDGTKIGGLYRTRSEAAEALAFG